MWACYALVQNFGWAIIIFTFIVKAAMFPLNLKQQKSMAISQLYTPRVREIQTKYKNNPEKQQEELTKLQKEGYNPTGGCGVMVLTFLILFGVIDVVYKPMTHMEHFKSSEISAIVGSAKEIDLAQTILASPEDAQAILEFRNDAASITIVKTKDENGKDVSNQVKFAEDFNYDESKANVTVTAADLETYGSFTTDEIKVLVSGDSRLSSTVKNNINLICNNYYVDGSLYKELRALKAYEKPEHRALFETNEEISSELIARLDKLSENMYFGPINLIDQPTWEFNILLIIPVISFLFSMAQMFVSQYIQKKQNPQLDAAQPQGAKLMLWTMPFLSLWISFTVPAGAGFYWAISYLFAIVQSLVTAKFWPSDKIRAEAQAKMDAAAKAREQKAKVVIVDADGNKTEKTQRVSELSQKEAKELTRKKIEAARKAMALKYDEEYIESNDDDI